MKKIVAFFFASIFMVQSFAAVSVELPARKATEVLVPLGNTGKTVTLQQLTTMSLKEYQALSGRHLKLTEKIGFKVAQKELRKTINNDGTINTKKLDRLTKKVQKAAMDNKRALKLALIFAIAAIVFSILSSVAGFFWVLASLAWLAAVVFFIVWLVNMAQ